MTILLVCAGVSLGATAAMAWCLREMDRPTPQRDPDHPSLTIVNATDWDDQALGRLCRDIGTPLARSLADALDPPMTLDEVPVTDDEWRAAVGRVLDASGRDQ
jgi:hypothetical protein